jgi:lysosomal acid lipase/cholesteryl ester hydrolase
MARLDLPAEIDYVLSATGKEKLTWVGHSEGTMQAFAAFSLHPEVYSSKVNLFVALAPVAYVTHTTSAPFVLMGDLHIEQILDLFGEREFLPSTKTTETIFPDICEATPYLCLNILFLTCGVDRGNLNSTRLPLYLAYTPSGTSVHNMVHFASSFREDQFGEFDYGKDCLLHDCNKKHYGTDTPPQYDLTKVSVPTALFRGGNDSLADATDVARLKSLLPNVVHDKLVPSYMHLDFTWGLDAHTLVYADVIQLCTQYAG